MVEDTVDALVSVLDRDPKTSREEAGAKQV
jgi:hypothetical protein